MKIFVNVILGTCFMLTCSGCFYLTKTVANIGVRNECLQSDHILVSSNGAVALECTAIYVHPTIWNYSGKPEEKARAKKYMVASLDVFHWTVTNAVTSNQSQSKSTEVDSSLKLVNVKQLAYASTDYYSWRIIPFDFGGRDATPQDLPQQFGNFVFTKDPHLIPYELNGQHFQVQLPIWNYNTNRTSRRWWGYPIQILVLPAIAVDVIAWPYEFSLGAKEFGKAF